MTSKLKYITLIKCNEQPNYQKTSKYVNDINSLIKLYKAKILNNKYHNIDNKLKGLKDKLLKKDDGTYKLPIGNKDEECYLISKWQEHYNIIDSQLTVILMIFKCDYAYYSKLIALINYYLNQLAEFFSSFFNCNIKINS